MCHISSPSDIHECEPHLQRRIDCLHTCLQFLVGDTRLAERRSVERLKRHIRACATLLNRFLMTEPASMLSMGCLLPAVIIPAHIQHVQQHIATLAKACQTVHAALYVGDAIYTCTQQWSSLDVRDLFTISTYLGSLGPACARDVPVYLPHSSINGESEKVGATHVLIVCV